MNDLEHAVSTAYTYLSHNPNDSMMIDNLNYYAKQKGFSPKFFRDLKETEHQKFYIDGVSAYEKEIFNDAVGFFEDALNSFFEAESRCRILCDGPWADPATIGRGQDQMNSGGGPGAFQKNQNDFSISFAEQFWSRLRCRNNCTYHLSFIRGNYLPDFIPGHFNYLQFAYYKSIKNF